MTEQGFEPVRKKLRDLPGYDPDDSVWSFVDAWLNFEEQLKNKLPDLPAYSPVDSAWENIENAAHRNKYLTVNKRILYYTASAAAVIFLGTLLTMKLILNHRTRIQITTEFTYTVRTEDIDQNWPDPLNFINNLCKLNANICTSPGFIEKKKLLEELAGEENKLLQYEAAFGSSDVIEKSKVRIEKIRSDVIKELLEMIEG
jgi:hypothetical protein